MIFGRSRQPRQPQPTCGCGHHLAMHNRAKGTCGYTKPLYSEIEEVVRSAAGNPVLDAYGRVQTVESNVMAGTQTCGCAQYVGAEVLGEHISLGVYVPPAELSPSDLGRSAS